jgi:serine/threonine-protein kinase
MDTSSAAPAALGKYEVRGILGRGAMGTVYDGWDPVISRHVAIKTVPLLDPNDPEMRDGLARFRREAQAAGRLTHPNIVGVYDYGETTDAAYIVMEYVEGQSLKDRLDRGERLALDEIVRVMEQMLAALHFSHGRGVVHRDIKPGNVMMAADGQVKLTDFGIARIESSSMTQDGTMLGTPAYMSPEQLMAQPVDARSDIYSAGVVLYQLLTGGRPYEGGLSAIILKVFNTVPPPPSEVPNTASRAFDAVVARAMARPPEARYPTAAAFAEAIREAFAAAALEPPRDEAEDDATAIHIAPRELTMRRAPEAPVSRAAPPPVRRSNTALYGGVAAVALLLIGGGAWLALRPSAPPSASPSASPGGPSQAPVASSGSVAPVAPTPPPEPPAPDLVAIRADLARLALGADCAVSRLGVDEEVHAAHVDVGGVVGEGAPAAALRQAVGKAGGGLPIAWHAMTVDGPYCGVLDMLRPIAQPVGPFNLALASNSNLLHDRDPIEPVLTMPEFPAYLVVDYISSDGSVARLYPAPGNPEKALAANATLSLRRQEVGPPFGTDVMVAIASSVPLDGQRRPGGDETVKTYLAAMQPAIESARAKGAKVTARVIGLHTVEK